MSRILVIDPADRILLLHAQETTGYRFWITPGGGLEGSETFEAAAERELAEETGIVAPPGPWVWTRRHVYREIDGFDQYERFFVVRLPEARAYAPTRVDAYVVGHRWWTVDEIRATPEGMAPRRMAALLPPIVAGDYPSPPINCGV